MNGAQDMGGMMGFGPVVPEKDEPETSPRQVVARTVTYLRNQQDKMR